MTTDPSIASPDAQELGSLSQWQLIGLRFRRHRLANISLNLLLGLYVLAIFSEFFALYPRDWRNLDKLYSPPQIPHFSFREGLHTTTLRRHVDPITLQQYYIEEKESVIPLGFFVRGQRYKLLGVISWDRHFFGIDFAEYDQRKSAEDTTIPTFYLLGADKYGRDLFSRLIFGSRISLSIGLIAILVTFVLGISIGGLSGYVGGSLDNLIQRLIEIINSFPQLPMWIALAAVMPKDWSPLRTYFAITIVLSLLNWTGLARVVRGKILSLREEDYAVAARLIGASHGRILFRHLVPGFTSHIIVSLTLTVPGMILGETGLSFLGLGLRPPIVSWGVLLQDCLNLEVVANYPWLLMPVVFIVLTVLCFNFLGDGLRDAADPYA